MYIRAQQNPAPQDNRHLRKAPKTPDGSNKKSTPDSSAAICNRLKTEEDDRPPPFFTN